MTCFYWIQPFAGALAFDLEYARWLEEHNRQVNELRTAVNSHAGDTELRIIVDGVISHYEDIFRLKGIAAKADVFHVLSGMWKTPAERCFLWLGGFRSSELLKVTRPLVLKYWLWARIDVQYVNNFTINMFYIFTLTSKWIITTRSFI